MHGECGELPWPWPGAPLSEVFVVELTRGGSFLVGDTTPCVRPDGPSVNKAC